MKTFPLDNFRFLGGGAKDIAMINVRPEQVGEILGVQFVPGHDDLDYTRELGLTLPSGRSLILLWHERAPVLGLVIMADPTDDPSSARGEALTVFKLSEAELMWAPDDPSAWETWQAKDGK
jgi:hypothetical protein